uniref:Uncharacterized protein n=1 Tax=Fagus sylvatica TaxID=28930 RepID=A0A2N9GGW6_FAGSY
MVLPMLALAKLKLLSPSHSLSPMVTSLVWPFLLKMSFSFRIVRGAYTDLVLASRLFFFQLGQIALNPEPAFGNTTRLERALRAPGFFCGESSSAESARMSDSKRVGILARVDPICTLRHSRCKAFSDPLDPSATAVSSPTRSACTFLSLPPPSVSHDLHRSCSSVWIFRSPARMSRRLLVLWSVWCELYLRITPAQPHRRSTPKP